MKKDNANTEIKLMKYGNLAAVSKESFMKKCYAVFVKFIEPIKCDKPRTKPTWLRVST